MNLLCSGNYLHNIYIIFAIIYIVFTLWCWERLRAGREGDNIGWDGWMASLTQWAWVWVNWGVGDGQGGLVCYSPWGHKESDTSEQRNCIFYHLSIHPSIVYLCLIPFLRDQSLNWERCHAKIIILSGSHKSSNGYWQQDLFWFNILDIWYTQ